MVSPTKPRTENERYPDISTPSLKNILKCHHGDWPSFPQASQASQTDQTDATTSSDANHSTPPHRKISDSDLPAD
jgi:hypothetical protein